MQRVSHQSICHARICVSIQCHRVTHKNISRKWSKLKIEISSPGLTLFSLFLFSKNSQDSASSWNFFESRQETAKTKKNLTRHCSQKTSVIVRLQKKQKLRWNGGNCSAEFLSGRIWIVSKAIRQRSVSLLLLKPSVSDDLSRYSIASDYLHSVQCRSDLNHHLSQFCDNLHCVKYRSDQYFPTRSTQGLKLVSRSPD